MKYVSLVLLAIALCPACGGGGDMLAADGAVDASAIEGAPADESQLYDTEEPEEGAADDDLTFGDAEIE